MTRPALCFAKKQSLPAQLCLRSASRIQHAVNAKLGRRRKVQQFLDLGHKVDLASSFEDIYSLLRGNDWVPIEVRRTLLKLRKIFDGLQRPLRTEQALNVNAAQRGSLNPMPELLRANVPDQMRGAVRVPIHVAIEAGDAAVRAFATAVLGLIELLLRERRYEQAQPLYLLRVHNSVEQFVVVVNRHHFALGDVAQIRSRGQIDGRRKLRHDVVGQIEIEIEA